MNARRYDVIQTGTLSMQDDARWQLLQRVLASPFFIKAPRMSALLSFLVTRTLDGLAATLNEFTIGAEVFRRVARDFDTTIDPVVRVQMGRLRERLARYDAMPGSCGQARIVIPPGSYVPVLTAPVGAPLSVPLSVPPVRPRRCWCWRGPAWPARRCCWCWHCCGCGAGDGSRAVPRRIRPARSARTGQGRASAT